MGSRILFDVGLVLVLGGFVLAFASILMLMARGRKSGSNVRGGGIVMIGPFPIIFGTDKESVKTLILLSIVLIGVVLTFMLFESSRRG
jgi:uncharacterized protein (TIGR00304 family)